MMQSNIFERGRTDVYQNTVDQQQPRFGALIDNLTGFQGTRNRTTGAIAGLVPDFDNLEAVQQRSALVQAFRKEKTINNLNKMKGKDEHVFVAVQSAINKLSDPDLRGQLSNVFKGFALSVEDHYGEKAKDLTLNSIIGSFSGQIRAQKQKERMEERRAKLNASQFFYLK